MKTKILRQFPDYIIYSDARVYSFKTKKFLSPGTDKNGYKLFCLMNKYGNKQMVRRGRLNLTAHERRSRPGEQCNYINLNKQDDSISNIEWTTRKVNIKHYWESRRKQCV